MGTGSVAVTFALACPSCPDPDRRLVNAEPQSWTGPDGAAVAVLAGRCRRCGSLVAMQPSDDATQAVREHQAHEESRREALARLRAALDGTPPPLDEEAADAAREAVAVEVVARQAATVAAP